MPRKLSTKISISILGVLALALLSSGVALKQRDLFDLRQDRC